MIKRTFISCLKILATLWFMAATSLLYSASQETADKTEKFVASDHRPVFSPDGRNIVFMSSRNSKDWGNGEDWELYLIRKDGSALQRLTKHRGWDGYAVWARDGKSIIFDREEDGQKSPYRYDFNTGKTTPFIVKKGVWASVTDWSPDGKTVVLFIEQNKKRDLYFADADGTNLRQVTRTPDQNEHDAHFSPDGKKLAFAVTFEGGSAFDIMDLKSGTITRQASSTQYLYALSWSPDGMKIVFADTPNDKPDGNAELFVLDVKTGSLEQVTHNDDYDHMPVWLPDGSGIMFTSYRSGREEIYILNLKTGETKSFRTGLEKNLVTHR